MSAPLSMLLIPEHPLQVLPTLAKNVGLNEAILLQQLHYWSLRSRNDADGQTWVYNTATEWQEQFPFWSESTIKRTIASLRDQDLIVVRKSPHNAMDRTNWYRVNYGKVPFWPGASVQNDPMGGSDCTDGEGQPEPMSIGTETTSETTSETPVKVEPPALFEVDQSRSAALTQDEVAALAILLEVPRANGSKRPTLEAVEKVHDRYPELGMEVLAREMAFWATHGNGALKSIKSVMGTFATFARKAEDDRVARGASQNGGKRVASSGEASSDQSWERPNWT